MVGVREETGIHFRHAGKSIFRAFPSYTKAKTAAEKIVRDLASDSAEPSLSTKEIRDALAARDVLAAHFRATGRQFTVIQALSVALEADKIMEGGPVLEALQRFKESLGTVRPITVEDTIAEFLSGREAKTQASQLSAKYVYQTKIILERVAATFPATQLMDLGKSHLEVFFANLASMSPKSRNHHRAAIKNLLAWAIRMDYLPPTHRLAECDALRPERSNLGTIEFYTPGELRRLLDTADENMRPMLAISGLAGLRTAECFRITWQDVFRISGHIEVSSSKSKTRQRRLVEICPALSQWLQPHQGEAGPVWPMRETAFHEGFERLCEALKLSRKANGLRHSFVTYHHALYQDEGRTAAQSGNSPSMVHSNYRGLSTKDEAAKWFDTAPAPTAENVLPLHQARSA